MRTDEIAGWSISRAPGCEVQRDCAKLVFILIQIKKRRAKAAALCRVVAAAATSFNELKVYRRLCME